MLCLEVKFQIMLHIISEVKFRIVFKLNLNLIMLLHVATTVHPNVVPKAIMSLDVKLVDING